MYVIIEINKMHITATELNKHPGTILDAALREPVIIQKSGRSSAVMVSYEYYLELENAFWGTLAESVEKTAEWESSESSIQFLTT
jgi:prevent-host-death family protein